MLNKKYVRLYKFNESVRYKSFFTSDFAILINIPLSNDLLVEK